VIESHRVPAYWPSNTKNDSLLVAENLVIKYAPDLPAVLHDVSFTLKAGERVGLLGRTGSFDPGLYFNLVFDFPRIGSGKSTLAMSIFRFVG
jgi:energy-coupling factor transporter ATP-binding protein EcfA2